MFKNGEVFVKKKTFSFPKKRLVHPELWVGHFERF
jgi:hypothetical protein